jgi:hypothetical protein
MSALRTLHVTFGKCLHIGGGAGDCRSAAFGEPAAPGDDRPALVEGIAGESRELSDLSAEFLDALIAIASPNEATLMPQQPRRRGPLRRAYRSLLSRLR